VADKPVTTSTEALIWANRFINIGIGTKRAKACNERQAECMQAVIDEARTKAMDECIERINRLGLFIGDGDAIRLQVTEAIKTLRGTP
jgi:hypothetical protein